jgi:uncharacterized repeat protein (TIGR02543 family)
MNIYIPVPEKNSPTDFVLSNAAIIDLSAGRQTLKLETNDAININDIIVELVFPNLSAPIYNVMFDLVGGGGGPANIIGQSSSSLASKPSPDPTRPGYTFGGWSVSSVGTTAITFPYTLTNNSTTLYAVWTASTYTVTFNCNGGTNCPTPFTVTLLPPNLHEQTILPTRTGYTFGGWSVSSVGTTAITFPYTLTDANTTLYAIWNVVVSDPCAGIATYPGAGIGTVIPVGTKYIYNGNLYTCIQTDYWTEVPPKPSNWRNDGPCGSSGGCSGTNVNNTPFTGSAEGWSCSYQPPAWSASSSYGQYDRVIYVCSGIKYFFECKNWHSATSTTPNNNSTYWTCLGTCP